MSQTTSVAFGKWRLVCNPDATRQANVQIRTGGPETCGCRDCLNFVASRDTAYPEAILSLFTQLGIDPRHEAEIYHMGRLGSGKHLYGGWFHFVGAIASEAGAVGPFDMEQGDDAAFRIFFANKASMLPDAFVGQPVVQLEFVAQVPWSLGSPEPD